MPFDLGGAELRSTHFVDLFGDLSSGAAGGEPFGSDPPGHLRFPVLSAGHSGPSHNLYPDRLVTLVTLRSAYVAVRLAMTMDHSWLLENVPVKITDKDRPPADCFLQPTSENATPRRPRGLIARAVDMSHVWPTSNDS
ncbi:hypothetical protein GCM10012278_09490 [Nonomuraea glycinis]|uniref:Uncharacterized protein n=1 Tax=Nonomuraea glycinis TaxID=2047744 RepID=A0A918A1J3_9ACTN|nr:hypothetical protein GCM10012278_09490 [Nonomuraea glycinis]